MNTNKVEYLSLSAPRAHGGDLLAETLRPYNYSILFVFIRV